MRPVPTLILGFTLCALGAAGPAERPARAEKQPNKPPRSVKKELEGRTLQAMESFDLLEFESARQQLGDLVTLAKKNGFDREPILARVFLNLGIVEFAGLKNREAARQAFAAAVEIDPAIEIGVAYRTDAMAELLAAVKQAAAGEGRRPAPDEGGEECAALVGVEHAPVDLARVDQPRSIMARVGKAVGAEKVSVFYRTAGQDRYTELPMRRSEGCTYVATIPASAMHGGAVDYYVAAVRGGQMVAGQGSKASPNIIELATPGDPPPGAALTRTAPEPATKAAPRFFLSLAVGTGGGYVTGQTEQVESDVDCCFAAALLHVFPEIGVHLTRRLSLSAAFRMGFAIGANVDGHATFAPAGLLRVRYALSESGSGFQVSGAAGGGIIRHVVEVEEQMPGEENDTTASGPFLLGAGLGYLLPLSGPMRLVAELNALAAFPAGIEEVGSCPGSGCVHPYFGVQVDANLGLLVAF